MFIPVSVAVIVDMAPVEKRGQVLGMAFAAGQLALMLGPLVGGFLVGTFGFNAAFYTCFTVSLIGLLVTLLRYKVLPAKPSISVDTDEKSWSWLKKRIIIAILLVPLLVASGSNTINTYMPLYGQTLGIAEAGVGLIIAIFYASSAIMQVPAGRFIDRIGPKPIILTGLALCAVALATFSRFHTLPHFCIVAVFFGLGVGMAMPGALFLMSAQAPVNVRSMAMAMFTSVFQIGLALGTTIMGFVADATGFQTMFLVSSGSLVLGWLTALVLTRDRHAAP
jgi:predicted MFS family arabinose efflux permease